MNPYAIFKMGLPRERRADYAASMHRTVYGQIRDLRRALRRLWRRSRFMRLVGRTIG